MPGPLRAQRPTSFPSAAMFLPRYVWAPRAVRARLESRVEARWRRDWRARAPLLGVRRACGRRRRRRCTCTRICDAPRLSRRASAARITSPSALAHRETSSRAKLRRFATLRSRLISAIATFRVLYALGASRPAICLHEAARPGDRVRSRARRPPTAPLALSLACLPCGTRGAVFSRSGSASARARPPRSSQCTRSSTPHSSITTSSTRTVVTIKSRSRRQKKTKKKRKTYAQGGTPPWISIHPTVGMRFGLTSSSRGSILSGRRISAGSHPHGPPEVATRRATIPTSRPTRNSAFPAFTRARGVGSVTHVRATSAVKPCSRCRGAAPRQMLPVSPHYLP